MAMASFIVLSAAVIGATAHWAAEILLDEYRIRQRRKAAERAADCTVVTLGVWSNSELSRFVGGER